MIERTQKVFLPERWFFDVNRLPCFHYRYLVEGSCGIPFYCEELLKNLDHHRVLVFQPMESEEKANVTWNNLFSKSHSNGSFSLCSSAERVARKKERVKEMKCVLTYRTPVKIEKILSLP